MVQRDRNSLYQLKSDIHLNQPETALARTCYLTSQSSRFIKDFYFFSHLPRNHLSTAVGSHSNTAIFYGQK